MIVRAPLTCTAIPAAAPYTAQCSPDAGAAAALDDSFVIVGTAGAPAGNDNESLGRSAAIFEEREGVLREDIGFLLREYPGVDFIFGSKSYNMDADLHSLEALGKGDLHYPRLNGILSLLSGERGMENTRIINNGPGHFPHLEVAAAQLGYQVLVKEPFDHVIETHKFNVRRFASAKIASRISYVEGGLEALNKPTPADIVFWINPSPRMNVYGLKRDSYLQDFQIDDFFSFYIGRDVKRGGYLVLQWDVELFDNLKFDPKEWDEIFRSPLTPSRGIRGIVLPTSQHGSHNTLAIYRRKPAHPDRQPAR